MPKIGCLGLNFALRCLLLFIIHVLLQVDMSKVKLDVLKPWITQKITEILKMEDDVVIDYVNNQLEEKVDIPIHT